MPYLYNYNYNAFYDELYLLRQLSNMSYNSSGNLIFDGVNDTIDTGYALTSLNKRAMVSY